MMTSNTNNNKSLYASLLLLLSVSHTGAFVIPVSSLQQQQLRIPAATTRLSASGGGGSYANTTTTTNGYGAYTPLVDDLWDQKQRLDSFLVESPAAASYPEPQQQEQTQRMEDVWNARFLLIGAAALYGTNFSFVKLLGDYMPVGVSSTLRFGLAALATLPWLLQPPSAEENGGDDATVSFNAAAAGFEVGMWNSVGYIAQAVGLETTDASKSAFLCSLAVVVVPLLDFMFGKKLLPREVAGVVMAVLGVAVLELADAGAATDFSLSSGDICSLIQPLAFGLGFWRMESAMRKYPNQANRSTAAQLMAVFLASTAYGAAVGFPELDVIVGWVSDPNIFMALVWTGCITTALTVYMETLALKTLSAAETTLIFSTEPLWGSACASVVMSEQLGMGTLGGGALILAGCVVSNLGLEGIVGGFFNNKEDNDDDAVPSNNWFPSALAAPFTSMTAAAPAFAMEADSIETKSMDVVEEVIKNAAETL